MTELARQYPEVYQFLSDHLNDDCLLQFGGLNRAVADATLAHWLDCADENGHIEIPARYSRTGAPVTATFPELAQ